VDGRSRVQIAWQVPIKEVSHAPCHTHHVLCRANLCRHAICMAWHEQKFIEWNEISHYKASHAPCHPYHTYPAPSCHAIPVLPTCDMHGTARRRDMERHEQKSTEWNETSHYKALLFVPLVLVHNQSVTPFCLFFRPCSFLAFASIYSSIAFQTQRHRSA